MLETCVKGGCVIYLHHYVSLLTMLNVISHYSSPYARSIFGLDKVISLVFGNFMFVRSLHRRHDHTQSRHTNNKLTKVTSRPTLQNLKHRRYMSRSCELHSQRRQAQPLLRLSVPPTSCGGK
jgi:hypothetical protein